MFRALYDTLGVEPNATEADIRAAYRQKAKDNHPDTKPEEERAAAEKAMAAINHAYGILLNPDKRRAYDTEGKGAPEEERKGAIAYQVAINVFMDCVNSDYPDPLREAMGQLRTAIANGHSEGARLVAKKSKMEEKLGRLVHKKAGSTMDSFLHSAMTRAIKKLEGEIDGFGEAARSAEAALRLLQVFSYEPDPADQDTMVLTADKLFDMMRNADLRPRKSPFFKFDTF